MQKTHKGSGAAVQQYFLKIVLELTVSLFSNTQCISTMFQIEDS